MFLVAEIIEVKGTQARVRYANTESDFVSILLPAFGEITITHTLKQGSICALYKSEELEFIIGGFAKADEEIKNEISFKDGLKVEYDEENKSLTIENVEELTIKTKSKVNIEASEVSIGKGAVAIDGVVTGACLCAFTGAPHADYSAKVKASK